MKREKFHTMKLSIGGKPAGALMKFSEALGLTLDDTGSYLLTFGIVFYRYIGIIKTNQSKNSEEREQADYDFFRAIIADVRRVKMDTPTPADGHPALDIEVKISADLMNAMCKNTERYNETAAVHIIEFAISTLQEARAR